MSDRTLLLDGIRVPRFLYGTAWKEDRTRGLVELALKQGFRGFDTANQRKHYHESAVGGALAEAVGHGPVARSDLFIQTKFTFRSGQDHRLPYDPRAPIAVQVDQSLASSRQHLQVETIDSYLLHGPSRRSGLGAEDWAAWRAMEELHERGLVRLLGVSNFTLEQLQALCHAARVRPRFVQNRCYASRGWDRTVRQFCTANGIVYQGFSLLTANRDLWNAGGRSPTPLGALVSQIARRHGRSVAQIVFRFALDVGILPLTGTSDPSHMRDDLGVWDFQLEPGEVARIERGDG
jgi:diketogulonate reductase-like aldo/keto reductase